MEQLNEKGEVKLRMQKCYKFVIKMILLKNIIIECWQSSLHQFSYYKANRIINYGGT